MVMQAILVGQVLNRLHIILLMKKRYGNLSKKVILHIIVVLNHKHKECRNGNSLGIELCSRKDSDGDYYFTQGTIDNAIKLVRELMTKYNIPIR